MTSSLDNSLLSAGEKSELDIELELCEELLGKEENGCDEIPITDNNFNEMLSKLDKPCDPDVLSIFCESDLETDISTLEEFEISTPECEDTKDAVEMGKKDRIEVEVKVETNYLIEEREDIDDPGWESIKMLSNNEERYKQVRECWKSSTVPDPNKNLTYHSHRKRHFQNLKVVPKTRKRGATSTVDVSMLNPAKRQRTCTFLYDQNIDSLSAEKDKKKRDLYKEMDYEVKHLNSILYQQEQSLQRHGRQNFNAYRQLYNLRVKYQREIESVQQQYTSRIDKCTAELQYDINELNNARDEVLQFYNFYKGYDCNDPTVLTTFQLQELDEIENVFSQFNKLYNK